MSRTEKVASLAITGYWISTAVLLVLYAYVSFQFLRAPSILWGQNAKSLFFLVFVFGAPATAALIAAGVSLIWRLRPTRPIQVVTHVCAVFYPVAFWAVVTSDSL
jgi:hypothetical protein